MSEPDPRRRLAEQQTRLAHALMRSDGPLEGFDQYKLAAAAISLARKRRQSVARAWPILADALGEHFADYFGEYAARCPLPRDAGPLADGRAFAAFLAEQGRFPEDARLEVMAVDLRFVRTAHGLSPRRGFALKIAYGSTAFRIVIAVWAPWLGERWLRF